MAKNRVIIENSYTNSYTDSICKLLGGPLVVLGNTSEAKGNK